VKQSTLGLVSIVVDSATDKNFLTSLVGPHHTLRAQSVDMAVVEAKLAVLLADDASAAQMGSQVHSNLMTTPLDPRISTGGKCFTGTPITFTTVLPAVSL